METGTIRRKEAPEVTRARNLRWRDGTKCPSCGGEKPSGKALCVSCQGDRNGYFRAEYHRLTADGLCTKCKGPLGERIGRAECSNCASNSASRVRDANRLRRPQLRERRLRKNYGITSYEYDSLLRSQDGRCAICGSSAPGGKHGRFQVDHDHVTGAVRGLLCDACNRGLGFFRDSEQSLASAADYLQRSREQTEAEA